MFVLMGCDVEMTSFLRIFCTCHMHMHIHTKLNRMSLNASKSYVLAVVKIASMGWLAGFELMQNRILELIEKCNRRKFIYSNVSSHFHAQIIHVIRREKKVDK